MGRRLHLGCGAQVGPGFGGDGEKDLDDLGVELCSGATSDLVPGFGEAGSFAVGPVGGHGIKCVCDGEDARAKGNLFATQAAWIASSVELLLMGVDDLGGIAEEGDLADHLVAALAVLLHDGHLFGGESAGFEKNGVGGGDLSDVVEEGSTCDDS